MQKSGIRKTLSGIFAALMIISAVSGIALAFPTSASARYEISLMDEVTIGDQTVNEKVCNDVEEETLYNDDEIVTIMVSLDDNPVLKCVGTVSEIKNGARTLTEKGKNISDMLISKQNSVFDSLIKKNDSNVQMNLLYNYSLAFNGMAVEAPYGMLEKIRATEGVKNAYVSPVFEVPETDMGEDLTTQMASAGDMVGAFSAWDCGYDGEGTLIAVIDTGLYTDHEAFQKAPEKLKLDKETLQTILDNNELQAEKKVSGLTADMLYLRDKIPFAFDYANGDCDVNHGRETTSNDHGTHVAGIAVADPQEVADIAGADNLLIRGVAYKAQLVDMKVFGDNGGGASWAPILAAMEDTVYLGVDAVNISIGNVSSFPTLEKETADVFDLLYENGVNVSVAGGNWYNSGYSSTWNTATNTTLNLENSMINTPASYREALAVASVNNSYNIYSKVESENGIINYINVGDMQLQYFDTAVSTGNREDLLFENVFGGKTVEYVIIDGNGTPSDFEGVDVSGKVVVVQRGGGLLFTDKHINAYNSGAAGLIVYDNCVESPMIGLTITDFLFPTISMRHLSGKKLIEAAGEDKVGSFYVMNCGTSYEAAGDGYEPSDFSSWGPLSDLEIKPEIAAPGGNIISTVDFYLGGNEKSHYASYSGTSMATPGVTACLAVIRQKLSEKYPDLTAKEKADIAFALAMSTAVPAEHDGTPYGVRRQGAGVINANNAVSSEAYITVDGQNHPKIELGDDPERTGVYTLKFNVTNMGSETLTYDISPILTIPGYTYVDQGYRATYVQADYNKDCTDMMTFKSNMPDNRVTVEGGKTVSVEVTMTVNDEFRSIMNEVFKYGSYVEGYCRLKAVKNAEGLMIPDISVCYLGYYGSWCECPVVDSGFYYDEPENDLSSTLYPNTAGSKINTLSYMELGMNPYFDCAEEFKFLADRCSISPLNEDRRYDAVDYFLTGIMRNLSKFYYRIYDPQSGNVYFEKVTTGDFAKCADMTYMNAYYPMGYNINKMKAWKGEEQEEGQTLMIRCGGEGVCSEWDESKAPMAYWEIPVTLDNTAPYIVNSYSDENKLYITISDNHYAAYAGAFDIDTTVEGEDTPEAFAEFCIAENERAAQTTIEIDMGSRESAYLLLGDYACNEAQYEIKVIGSDETPTPTESAGIIDEPTVEGVYYQQSAQLCDGETYVVTAKSDEYMALTANRTNDGLLGAKTTVTEEQGVNVIKGFATNGVEWKYDSGKLVNIKSGEKLCAGSDGVIRLNSEGSDWTFAGDKLLSGSLALTYTDAFTITEEGSYIRIFRKVVDVKDAKAFMNTNVRAEEKTIFADITFKTDEPVASGVLTLGYDAENLDFVKVRNGEMMSSCFVQVNDKVPGRLTIAYAGVAAIEADGSNMFSIEFTLKDDVKGGTLLLFELSASETLLDDSTTSIKVDAKGTEYIVSGGADVTEPPTQTPTEAPTTEPPTQTPTEAPTTEPPTQTPTEAPTTEPPTQTPTEAPTTELPTQVPITEIPTQTPTPVPPETGDKMGAASICLAIFGISGLGYIAVRGREQEEI